jgi:hypothetical protein
MSIVKDVLKSEMTKLITTSQNLNQQVQTAKTKAKKTYYSKKLQKNNVKLAKVLQQLNVLENK